MTHLRVTLAGVTIGQVTVLTMAVVVGGVAAAPRGQTLTPNQGAQRAEQTPQKVNTPCDGVDLDAIRRYRPNSRTDAHIEFPVALNFPLPASLLVATGASGNGRTKFTFSLNGATPTTCIYRGNGTNAYDFVKCKKTPLAYADSDDDDDDHDDGPSDSLPVAGTFVTADSLALHIEKGDRTAGTTIVHVQLDGPRSSSRLLRPRSQTDKSSGTRTDRTRRTRHVTGRSSTRTVPSSSRSA